MGGCKAPVIPIVFTRTRMHTKGEERRVLRGGSPGSGGRSVGGHAAPGERSGRRAAETRGSNLAGRG